MTGDGGLGKSYRMTIAELGFAVLSFLAKTRKVTNHKATQTDRNVLSHSELQICWL